MKKALLLLVLFNLNAYADDMIVNQREIEIIARMTGLAAYGATDPEALQAVMVLTEEEECDDGITPTEPPAPQPDPDPPEITREKKVSFYMQVTGGAEEIRNRNLHRRQSYEDEFAPLIQAQNEQDRDAAIRSLCNGRSTMDKIEMGSELFGLLSDVYNYSLLEGEDEYSSTDPTKNADEVRNITLQRQYNALNSLLYNAPYPPVGGVCRHASTLVTDFLQRCGLDTESLSQMAYATDAGGGHATVRVTDPESGNTYFLNWGQLIESEQTSGMAQYDIPAPGIRGGGMLIYHYEPNTRARYQGATRTNRGVVVARLMQVDKDYELTTFDTAEGGMVSETKTTIKQGSRMRVVSTSMGAHFVVGENLTPEGESETIAGVALSGSRQVERTLGNGLLFTNQGRLAIGAYSVNEMARPDLERRTQGVSTNFGVGASLARPFTHRNGSVTTPAISGEMAAEFYVHQHQVNHNEALSGDLTGAIQGAASLTHSNQRNTFGIQTAVQVAPNVDMQVNDNDYQIYVTKLAQTTTLFARRQLDPETNPGESVGARLDHIADVSGHRYTTTVDYSNLPAGYSSQVGFVVTNAPGARGGQNQYQARVQIDQALSARLRASGQVTHDLSAGVSVVRIGFKYTPR